MRTRDLIMEYIKKYFEEHCYAHSYNEIAEHIGIGKSTLHGHMKQLFLDGQLKTDLRDSFGCARAYRPKGYKAVKREE